MADAYPRDLIGYGAHPPHPRWPGDARIAVQFVMNYEEGGESCLLHGDDRSEAYLQEVVGTPPLAGRRNLSVESVYEYGSRAGFWRLMRLFDRYGIQVTCYAVAMALARHPDAARAMVAAGHEIASHGWRWIDYQDVPEAVERADLTRAIETIRDLTGERPLGWYTGRLGPNTRRLVVEEGGFLYDADAYNDDLPYWLPPGTYDGQTRPHLVIPYTLDVNDMKFGTAQGFGQGDDFFTYARDAFDTLYAEGETAPRMMSVGLHTRLIGRPGRVRGLQRFLDHIRAHDRVWVCRRVDIARHWHRVHPWAG
ncbi:allantoinase PuuE [Niveispirillum fermenti]|uniref:allantoinase PuuE n=1 Tax=Niveispirillum fermenti TaxID=1233113 RepID=UPI003A88EA07